jgi:hypothetical protein
MGPVEAGQRRARPLTGELTCRPDRPGRLRSCPQAQPGLRHGDRQRHHVRGLASSKRPLQAMLESMAGLSGPRDELTRFTTAVTRCVLGPCSL